jgi:hypothetical protein
MPPTSLALATVAATLSLAAPAAAQLPALPAPARTIVAVGAASSPVTVAPASRRDNAAIKTAVDAAQQKALPQAIAEGREYATKLAAAAGVALGPLVSVSNAPTSPYGGPFAYELGPFGPGNFCGRRTVAIFRTGKSGRRRVVGRRTRRVCVVPPRVNQAVTLTYAIA